MQDKNNKEIEEQNVPQLETEKKKPKETKTVQKVVKYVMNDEKANQKRKEIKQPSIEGLREVLKDDPETLKKYEDMIPELMKCDSFRSQVVMAKEELANYHKVVKYTNTMLKIYFNDHSRCVDNMLLKDKKCKSDPQYTRKIGRRRKVSDDVLKELKEELHKDNMSLNQVQSFLAQRDVKVDKKYVYGMCKKLNDVTCKKEDLLEEDRYKVTDDQLLKYCEDTLEFFKSHPVSADFFYNLDEVGCDIGVDARKLVMVHSEDCEKQAATPLNRDSNRITLLACLCMCGGQSCKQMMITKRVNLNNEVSATVKGRCLLAYQENGFLNSELFFRWFKQFVEYNNLKKKMLHHNGLTVLLMDNFGAHCSDQVLELAKENGIHLMWLLPHTSHLCQPEDLGIFGALKTFLSSENYVLKVIDYNELSPSVPKEERVKCMKKILEEASKLQIIFDGVSTVEDRVCAILDSWDKATSFKNAISAFNQAGFHVTSEFMNDKEINQFFSETEKTDFSMSELLKSLVIFDAKRSRELRRRLYPELIPKPVASSKDVVSVEYESTKQKRLESNKAKREVLKELESKIANKKANKSKEEKKPKKSNQTKKPTKKPTKK